MSSPHSAGTMNNGTASPAVPLLLGRNPGSRLLEPAQGSVAVCKVAGVQNLDARFMVSVERGNCAWTPGVGRLRRVSKPDTEVVHFYWDGRDTGVEDEGLITENPGHVYDTSAILIGC